MLGLKLNHVSSVSLAIVRGIHRPPVNSPHKGPVTQKMFPFDDVIMIDAFGYGLVVLCTSIKITHYWQFHSYFICSTILTQYISTPKAGNVSSVKYGTRLSSVKEKLRKKCIWKSIHQHLLCMDREKTWWRHRMETFSASLALCVGNSPVTSEFPTQRPRTRSFDVVFDLCLNKRLSKQWRGWWFETPSRSLWRHRIVLFSFFAFIVTVVLGLCVFVTLGRVDYCPSTMELNPGPFLIINMA